MIHSPEMFVSQYTISLIKVMPDSLPCMIFKTPAFILLIVWVGVVPIISSHARLRLVAFINLLT